jgi:REP element-mobilizing transposase RayT
MIDYRARERRFDGKKPLPDVNYMSTKIEELIAITVSEIVKENNLNIAAFNLCRDHMHILLVCAEDEVPKIMHKIKVRTARVCNKWIAHNNDNLQNIGNPLIKGINPLDALDAIDALDGKHSTTKLKDGSTPFWTQKYGCNSIKTSEHYWNTVNYIEKNKVKHNLPNNPKLKAIIQCFVKSYEECFKDD